MWPKTTQNYSPNFSLPKRNKKKIRFIILHYTGMKKESEAINRLCDFKSQVSSHYFIKRNGTTLNLVPDLYEAWHAGKSSWGNYKSLNKYSIGIELQNSGHDHAYENFSSKQINSLIILLKQLIKIYKINYKNILGHSDIAPDRKKDPGEKFPWKKMTKYKIALGHGLNEIKLRKIRSIKVSQKDKQIFFGNLYKLGYRKIGSNKKNNKNITLIKAFQRRFRQSLINGIIDKESLIISKNLLK